MDTKLTRKILINCIDDYVGLWQIVGNVAVNYPLLKMPPELKKFVLSYISEMLVKDLIKVGQLLDDGGFEAWKKTPKEAVAKIDEQWDGSRYKSDALYGIWFDITKKGETELKRLQEMEEK